MTSKSEPMFQPKLEHAGLYQAVDEILSDGPEYRCHSTEWEDALLASRAGCIKLQGTCRKPRAIHKSEGVLLVRCRRCPWCIAYRRREWIIRCLIEAQMSVRTWAITLTFRRYSRLWLEREADILHSPMDVAYACTSPYAKRVRSRSGAPLKYICSVEPHKDGSPHLHMLVFQSTTHKVLYNDLVKSWNYGFSKAKLAKPLSIMYVCKYLSKQMKSGSRIRASRPFGRFDPDELRETRNIGLLSEQVQRGP